MRKILKFLMLGRRKTNLSEQVLECKPILVPVWLCIFDIYKFSVVQKKDRLTNTGGAWDFFEKLKRNLQNYSSKDKLKLCIPHNLFSIWDRSKLL